MKTTGNSTIDNSPASWVIGSDEAGWGALAYALVVAAVAVPRDWAMAGVTDSKKLSEKSRERAFEQYLKDPGALYHIEVVPNEAIDEQRPWPALTSAHRRALTAVQARLREKTPDTPLMVVDGLQYDAPKLGVPGLIGLPKGDQFIPACSMASILAKVTRDRMMVDIDKQYPGYGFADHKGYLCKAHKDALDRLGPCPIHRRSYSPIKEMVKEAQASTSDLFPWEDI